MDLDQIDPVFFRSTHYLAPGKGAERAYPLLQQAMRQTAKVGMATLVLQDKEYLAAVRPARVACRGKPSKSSAARLRFGSLQDLRRVELGSFLHV